MTVWSSSLFVAGSLVCDTYTGHTRFLNSPVFSHYLSLEAMGSQKPAVTPSARWTLEIGIQVLMLLWQALYLLSHLPKLGSFLYPQKILGLVTKGSGLLPLPASGS